MTAIGERVTRRVRAVRGIVVAALAGLACADLWSTKLLLSRGDVGSNPFLEGSVHSLMQGLVIKVGCLVVIFAVALRQPIDRRAPMMLLGALVGWYGIVVAWNFSLAVSLPA